MLAIVALISPATAQSAERPYFDLDVHPAAPDYSRLSSWAALPDLADAAHASAPNDALKQAEDTASVDVFYIHPTTFHSDSHWNQDVSDAATNDWTDISVIARQASAFNACCKVYAPRYRQAATGAYGAKDDSGKKAFDLGYADVKRAFQYYLAHYNHGRPFILASHSQGTLDSYRLMAEMIDGAPLERRFIAAYAVGVGVSVGEFGHRFRSIQPCRKPADIRCIVSWNSFVRSGDPSAYLARSEADYASKYGQAGKTLLCVNPLTFDIDQPHGAAERALGSLSGKADHAPLPRLIASAVAADCVNGVLMVDAPTDAAFSLTLLPHGSLHYHDIDLYYENIRVNAAIRINAYDLQTKRELHPHSSQ